MKNPVKNLIWRTARGEDFQIRQMETSHIINCLNMMDRSNMIGHLWRERFRPTLDAELAKRKALTDREFSKEMKRMLLSPHIEGHNEHGDHGDHDDSWRGHIQGGRGDFE